MNDAITTYRAPKVPPQFTGRARRLIDTIEREDDGWLEAFRDALLSMGHRERYRKAGTNRFLQQIRSLPSTGVVSLEVGQKRHKTTVTVARVTAEYHRRFGWDDDERAVMVMLYGLTIQPDYLDFKICEPAAVCLHALARYFQRAPQATDSAVVAAFRPLILAWPTLTTIGETFSLSGWRGRVLWRPAEDESQGQERETLLGVRTFLQTEDDEL